MKKGDIFKVATVALCTFSAPAVLANGYLENRPWQFQTTADRANKAVVLDLIERKKGGFYDGFITNIHNETNIASQINCNNNANATANIADNGQAGPNTSSNGTPTISADGTANSDSSSVAEDPSSGGLTTQTSNQTNSGQITATIGNSDIQNSFGNVTNGGTDQALNNDQQNSGSQTAGVESSTACNMQGSTVTGTVNAPDSGPLN
ncbi:hypothetical protein [Roseovarius sp.]|uniref:hypothetical protein n=1 Tax=Roseovarius sp. TaxID=1486281 RepID=UPI0026216BCF|nr:hypothetical protein [Roseovarius sp.]